MSSLLDSLLLKVGTISRNSARIAEASASERKMVAHPCARPLCKHPPSKQQPQDDGSIVCELCGVVVGVEYKSVTNDHQMNAAEDPTTRADAPRASSSFEAQTSAQGETSEESRKRRLSETGATWSGRHANAQRIVAAEAARDAHNAHEGKAEQKNRGVQKALRKLMTADNVIPEESASVFRKNAYHALHANLQHRRVCHAACNRVDLMAVPSSLLAYLTIQLSVQNYLPDEAKNSLRISQLVAHTQTIIPHQSNVDEVKTELTRSLQEHHGSVSCVPCSVPVMPEATPSLNVGELTRNVYRARSMGLIHNSTRDRAILKITEGLPKAFVEAVADIDSFAAALLLCKRSGQCCRELESHLVSVEEARRQHIISTIALDPSAEQVDDI